MKTAKPDRSARQRAELVEALQTAAAYPHPIDGPVRLVETHVSHLFLTGQFAYKVKKPVDLGFLDFTTLEKRRRYTRDELVLNRALSPDVYLGICEVRRGADGQFRVGDVKPDSGGGGAVPDGEIEEYALKMRQLPSEQALDALVAAGRIRSGDVASLGRLLAAFHARADAAAPGSRFGGVSLVRKAIFDNLDVVGPWAEPLAMSEPVARVSAYTRGALDAFGPVIASRKAAGMVRDCHGDLHAENIFQEARSRNGPEFRIIDRIEFNNRFRFIDLASDLAFLTMDLKRLARPDLADALLSAYLSGTADPSVESIIGFYEVYRAMVRCKVAVLRVAEAVGGRPRGLRAAGKAPADAGGAREYVELAARLVAAQRPRAMFVMTGVTGSGKSTAAAELAARWDIRRVSSDVVRKTIFGIDPHRPSAPSVRDELYSPRMSFLTYQELVRQGDSELAAGRSVILDATFLKRDYRNKARDVARRHGVPFVVIECATDERTARARLRRRYAAGTSESDAGPELLAYHMSEWQAVARTECDCHVAIDTGGETARYMDEAEVELWRRLLVKADEGRALGQPVTAGPRTGA